MTVFTHPNAVLVSVVAVEVDAVGTAGARAVASSSSSSSDTTSYKRASSSRAGGSSRASSVARFFGRPRAVVRAFSPRADFSLGVVFAFGLAASRTLAGNRRPRAPTGSLTRARAASSAMRPARARVDD